MGIILSIRWVLAWVKTHNLIDCLRLDPKQASFKVINFLVMYDLRSLRIPILSTNPPRMVYPSASLSLLVTPKCSSILEKRVEVLVVLFALLIKNIEPIGL